MSDAAEAALRSLFSGEGDWPQCTAIESSSEQLELGLHIPTSLACFAGHFPQQPVLPGVMQLHWACRIAETVLGYRDFSGVGNIKYNSMLLPDTDCRMLLKPGAKGLRFSIETGDTRVTTGSISYGSRSISRSSV